MEAILGFIVVIVGWLAFWWMVGAVGSTAKAGFKTVVGKGSFKENMDLEFKGMEALEARIEETTLDGEPDSPKIWSIEVKGLLPLLKLTKVGFITSVLDETDDENNLSPVISAIDTFQEDDSAVYQHRLEIGEVNIDQGFTSWVRVGVVIPEILQTPYGGRRNLLVISRLVDVSDPPNIAHGFHQSGDAKIIWQTGLSKIYQVTEKGYYEESEHRDEARAIAIKMGVAIAMADGTLDDSEGNVIKAWIQKIISVFTENTQTELKEKYNNAFKEGFNLHNNNNLTLSSLTEEMNKIAEHTYKYEAIELCLDVMAADGVADPEELNAIKHLAEAMELDYSEIEKMRDSRLVGLTSNVTDNDSLEAVLGIEPEWDVQKIKSHLRSEFQKWNNRLNTLPEGEDRDSAQHRLDLIANARKQYN